MSCLKNQSGDGKENHSTINEKAEDEKEDNQFRKRKTKWVEEKRRQYQITNQTSNNNNELNNNNVNKTWREKKSEKRKLKRQERRKNKTNNYNNENTTIQQYHDEEETWGDEMTLSKDWPKGSKQERGFTRLIHLNLMELHQRTNSLNGRRFFIVWMIYKIAKSKDKSMVVQMESSKQSPKKQFSIFKPGGTMIGIRGTKSGRILKPVNDKSKDTMGRWTITHLKGKGSTIVSIVSVYQVCKNRDKGEGTAFLQQQADCYEKYK